MFHQSDILKITTSKMLCVWNLNLFHSWLSFQVFKDHIHINIWRTPTQNCQGEKPNQWYWLIGLFYYRVNKERLGRVNGLLVIEGNYAVFFFFNTQISAQYLYEPIKITDRSWQYWHVICKSFFIAFFSMAKAIIHIGGLLFLFTVWLRKANLTEQLRKCIKITSSTVLNVCVQLIYIFLWNAWSKCICSVIGSNLLYKL